MAKLSRKATVLVCAVTAGLVLGGGAGQAKKTVLNYWTWWGAAENAGLGENEKLAVTEFMKRNPDIEVKMTVTAWGAYHDKLLAAVAAGVGPDVYKADIYYMRDYMDTGIALNIDSYLKRDKVPVDSWYQFAMEPVTDPFTGRVYGFPSNWGGLVMYASRDFYARNGVPIPTGGWTWDRFVEDMQKMKKDTNGDGKFEQWGTNGSMYWWWAWVYSNGASLFNKDETKLMFDTPDMIEALKFIADQKFVHKIVPGAADRGADWYQGKSALMIDWSHVLPRNRAKFPVTLLEFPNGKKRVYTIKGDCMAINTVSRQKEAAWRFMKWYVSDEFQTMQLQKTGLAPLTKRAAESDWVAWGKKQQFDVDIKAALPQPGRETKLLEAGTPTWRKMEQVWWDDLNKIDQGKISAADGARNLQRRLEPILKAYWDRANKRKTK